MPCQYFYGNIGGGSDICHGEQVRVLCKKSGGGERSYIARFVPMSK